MKRKIRKNKKTARKKPESKKRTLTAADRQAVLGLAERLGKLVPLSSNPGFKSTFTLTKIAQAHGLSKFLPGKTPNKTEAFSKFLENLLVYRPLMPKKLIREILPRAIDRRHKAGDPILLDEATGLADQLDLLGITMRKEILALKLPKDRPSVVPPPFIFQKMLKDFQLHAAMLPECLKMFNDGHLNESVRKALEKFEAMVQQISGLQEIGEGLMGNAFSTKVPKIKLNSLSTPNEIDEQEGFKFMAMGMMRGWRNNLSHGNLPQMPPQEAFGRLAAISNMFHRLANRVP